MISVFTIVKNEAEYIGACIEAVGSWVDEIIYADGNSTDGTIDIIKEKQKKYPHVKLYENKDCKNLTTDYQRLFNWTLKQCKGDYVWFLHPDMIVLNPERIKPSINGALRYSTQVLSVAGEDKDKIIICGRATRWYEIFKNTLGLHFYGNYGDDNEDFYFRDITGNEHKFWYKLTRLPYQIVDTDIQIAHYCDTKPYERRLDRMIKIIHNNNPEASYKECVEYAKKHPRVTLKDGSFGGVDFRFAKASPKVKEVLE